MGSQQVQDHWTRHSVIFTCENRWKRWKRCVPGRYRCRALPNQCCVPRWSLKAQKWGHYQSKIIGLAILSYFILFTCKNRWKRGNRCAPGRYRRRTPPNQCCVPIWYLKAQNLYYNHSKIIGPAILSYLTLFTCKNRCKGETGAYWRRGGIEHY